MSLTSMTTLAVLDQTMTSMTALAVLDQTVTSMTALAVLDQTVVPHLSSQPASQRRTSYLQHCHGCDDCSGGPYTWLAVAIPVFESSHRLRHEVANRSVNHLLT